MNILRCPVCEGEYVSDLGACPSCRLKEIQSQIRILKAEKESVKAEIDRIEAEKDAYTREIGSKETAEDSGKMSFNCPDCGTEKHDLNPGDCICCGYSFTQEYISSVSSKIEAERQRAREAELKARRAKFDKFNEQIRAKKQECADYDPRIELLEHNASTLQREIDKQKREIADEREREKRAQERAARIQARKLEKELKINRKRLKIVARGSRDKKFADFAEKFGKAIAIISVILAIATVPLCSVDNKNFSTALDRYAEKILDPLIDDAGSVIQKKLSFDKLFEHMKGQSK